eukprot:11395687-Alexandrium_andersonii.AAC.1
MGLGAVFQGSAEQLAMHPELRDLYMEGESERGVVLWTRARGQLPSSTRAEAHAILLAIHAATPLHIATDSGAC